MSRLTDIGNGILAALQSIDGSGDFTLDLSGQGQALKGKYKRPPGATPAACFWFERVDEDWGPTQADLSEAGVWAILAWTKPMPKDPATRQDQAEELLENIRTALRADLTLGGNVLFHLASGASWEGEAAQTPDMQSHGICMVVVTATWRER